ncbi:Predicted AAA-ATPase [Sarcina sp. DSM 11001]|uniref:AAA family ATPase n=1 Tax=Sarcina sp. DSM 11001 TaxID=1798184 RepID=UPI00088F8BB1|nr:Predicted AAA-ATPase [Sarcina sp. DSM 11001]
MAEKLMLPIGEEFFSSIRRGNFYYVDKTAMLSDFLRRRGLITLFTRPRRFGKSLNIDMFKCFLEIGTDLLSSTASLSPKIKRSAMHIWGNTLSSLSASKTWKAEPTRRS